MLKGYRTYIAIVLTALVIGLTQMGILPVALGDALAGLLTIAGLYYRSQAVK